MTDTSNVGGGGTLFQWQALEKEEFDSAISQWGTEGLNRDGAWYPISALQQPLGGIFDRARTLRLDYVPPEEPPSTPLGNTLRFK